MSKSTKRNKELIEKKRRKAARFVPARNGVGNSKYAKKAQAQKRGKFSPRSPFRVVEDNTPTF